jgi:threonine dehydrogenase-like Zn-dependent dehydrogenase
MLMRALQVVRPRSFESIQTPVPQLPEEKGCILVRAVWGILCGSDIPFFTGNKRYTNFPLEPGAPIHECTGEVVESSSERFRPGDRVLAIPNGDQGLTEYYLAPASKAMVLDSAIQDLGAACIIQPLSTVISAIDRLGDLRGKSIAVLGLGSIGLMFCRLAKKRGASSIVGIDPTADRCRFAADLGATQTICCRGIELIHRARAFPGEWNAPDICIEAVGHQTETINDCLDLVRKYGTVVAFGVPDRPVYAMEFEIFYRKNVQLIATVTPDWMEYLPKAQDLYLADKEVLSRLVTHRFPIREAERAYGLYERHEDGIIKAALDARGW